MSVTRLLIVLCAGFLIADHELGGDRTIRSVAVGASAMAYQLTDSITHMLRRLSSG